MARTETPIPLTLVGPYSYTMVRNADTLSPVSGLTKGADGVAWTVLHKVDGVYGATEVDSGRSEDEADAMRAIVEAAYWHARREARAAAERAGMLTSVEERLHERRDGVGRPLTSGPAEVPRG